MPSVTISKQVKQFTQDNKFASTDFVRECATKPDYLIQHQNIVIEAPHIPPKTIQPEELVIPQKFSFGTLSAEQIIYLVNQLITVAFDPLKIAHHLKKLDAELGKLMGDNNISFDKKDLPAYLLASRGHFIPGAAPESYQYKKKGRLLDSLLLSREMQRGINMNGYAPKFMGFVSSSIADHVVANRYLFTENKHINRVLLHGSYSHRLLAEAFDDAINERVINLTVDDISLTLPQMLEVLVSVKTKSGFSLWESVFDSLEDTQNSSDAHPLDPDKFNFSCRSPFVLNSLLLCFGQELELPHLQSYLLDSHYKATQQMILNTKEKIAQQKGLVKYTDVNISDECIYDRCMEHFSVMASHFGEVGGNTPFTANENAPLDHSRYESTAWNVAIAKKISSAKAPGTYKSKISYLEEKGCLLEGGFFGNKETHKNKLFLKYRVSKLLEKDPLEKTLFAAANEGNAVDVNWLLNYGVNPNITKSNGSTLLHALVKSANTEESEFKIEKFKECAKIILEKGASRYYFDRHNKTPLQYDSKNIFKELFVVHEHLIRQI